MSTSDVFISHATEDKDRFVRPLAGLLRNREVSVWYDEFSLKIGMSLIESIDQGVANAHFGVLVVSDYFIEKKWTRYERRGLETRLSVDGPGKILPIWHEVDREKICAFAPSLADIVGISSSLGVHHVCEKLIEVVRPDLLFHRSKAHSPDPSASGSGIESGGKGCAYDRVMDEDEIRSNDQNRLTGDYSVSGKNEVGEAYRGRASIRAEGENLMVITVVHGETFVTQGNVTEGYFRVVGDFEVEYQIGDDGALTGRWGESGTEVLKPLGSRKVGEVE